jgi:hypothetical protein
MGPSFPSLGAADPKITSEKQLAYFIVSKAGAEGELSKMASLHLGYDWEVCPIQQSHEDGFVVVGRLRAN